MNGRTFAPNPPQTRKKRTLHEQTVDRSVGLACALREPDLETLKWKFKNKLTCHIIAHFMIIEL